MAYNYPYRCPGCGKEIETPMVSKCNNCGRIYCGGHDGCEAHPFGGCPSCHSNSATPVPAERK